MTLVLIAALIAQPATTTWKCTPARMVECNITGCEERTPTTWFELDERRKAYRRCDAKGCDAYTADVHLSGMFTIYELRGRATMLKMSSDLRQFIDVATSGVSAFVNTGSCAPLAPRKG